MAKRKTAARKAAAAPKPKAAAGAPAFDVDALYTVNLRSGIKQYVNGRELAARWTSGHQGGYAAAALRVCDADGKEVFSAA